MGGGKGNSGSTTTVQKADPWEGQQPYLAGDSRGETPIFGVFPEANYLYTTGQLAPEYYPGRRLPINLLGRNRRSRCRRTVP